MKSWDNLLEETMRERDYVTRDEFSLDELLELAREYEMTPSEKAEQRISFAYGMLPFENNTTTREDIERVARKNTFPSLRIVK